MNNSILDTENDVVARIAQRTLAEREAGYASEVRRLLDAALEVIRQGGTTSRPRVADIVAAAGLSNDAFYRHFPSKDALVAALLEDGAQRLARYIAHQMSKEPDPAGQVRRWVEGMLSQTREEIAATTLAVLWNGGSIDPDLDASLAAHAVVGKISDHLWQRATPTRAEIDHITAFCLRAATPR
jgi:AcrR family transcriptional regulator